MSVVERAGLWALKKLDPETAHGLALRAVRLGLSPRTGPVGSERLRTSLAGIPLQNPIGMAAGFDKNALAIDGLSQAGFGFLEVGGATPRPQVGNAKPRLFRLTEDQAVINRFGFNNEGAAQIAQRLAAARPSVPVGINLGANKDSPDRTQDYTKVLQAVGDHVAFATVNVSSPNTEKLRDLQGPAALKALLLDVMETRDQLPHPVPIFLKIAPDLDDQALAEIAQTALEVGVDAIIATNTTLARDGLKSPSAQETGGLSGAPLFPAATRVLARLYTETGGALPLIGVGGIASGADAYKKIRAGATAVQLYTALAYQGLSLVRRMAQDMDALLQADGHSHVAEAVGLDAQHWL